MVLKFLAGRFALITLFETAKLQWIVFSVGAYVVGKQIIMGDFVPLFSMLPVPADVLDQLAIAVNEHIVQRDHTLFVITGRRIGLHPLQSTLVECFHIPIDTRETRLIGGVSKLGWMPLTVLLLAAMSPVRYSAKWRRCGALANKSANWSRASSTT